MKIKKIAAIGGSLLMAGLSMATASAAVFPAPFSTNVASTAIVYGANAPLSTDHVAATNIQQALSSFATGSSSSTTLSGENILLQRPSSFLHVGNGVKDVFGRSITKSDMPSLLKDGIFKDSKSNDHDYTQKITVANMSLGQIDLSSYDNTNVSTNTPAIGLGLNSGENILNYTLTFQDAVNVSRMANEDLTLMGRSYYVLSATSSKITLLDSASSASLASGGSTTLTAGNTTYSVTANIFGTDQVQFTVNGVTTDLLKQGDVYKMADGSYIGLKTVIGAPYAGASSTVEFSIGSGKIELPSSGNVQVNSNAVDGVLSSYTVDNNAISSISVEWNAGNSAAITKDLGLTMPTLEGVKLSFAGMTYPSMETTNVSSDGNTAIKLRTVVQNGPVTLDLLGMNKDGGNFTTIGKDSTHLLQTTNTSTLDFNARGTNSSAEFVVSWNDSKEAESYVYKIGNFINDSGTLKADLISQDGGSTITMSNGTAVNVGIGNIVLTPTINYAAKTVSLEANPGTNFDTLYTKDGLKITLPVMTDLYANGANASAGYVTSYPIQFAEEAKDGTIAGGSAFNLTVGRVGTSGSYQTSVTGVSSSAGNSIEKGDSNVYQYTMSSPLATTIDYNQGPTQETAAITYHGGESYGKLYLASPSATVSNNGGAMGALLIKDSEVASTSATNLIVVGGSCVNTAAATLLGGAYCGTDFTAQTGVSAGQFLIKAFPSSQISGKYAVLVAGYDAADTTNAVTYLTKAQNVDPSTPIIKGMDAVASLS